MWFASCPKVIDLFMQTSYKPQEFRLLEEAAKHQEMQQVRARLQQFEREQQERKRYSSELKATLAEEYNRQIRERRDKEESSKRQVLEFETQALDKARRELALERSARLTRRK
jgi:hypothetical protein